MTPHEALEIAISALRYPRHAKYKVPEELRDEAAAVLEAWEKGYEKVADMKDAAVIMLTKERDALQKRIEEDRAAMKKAQKLLGGIKLGKLPAPPESIVGQAYAILTTALENEKDG